MMTGFGIANYIEYKKIHIRSRHGKEEEKSESQDIQEKFVLCPREKPHVTVRGTSQ